jgi:hypothetical protein
VESGALQPLISDTWTPALHAKWLDIDRGLLSGTFGSSPHLAVQLFHALTPLTGSGDAGGRVAGMLVGILAIGAVYALGRRVAGPLGAVTAVSCALLADPFRQSLTTGNSTGVLVLAACLFLMAVHRVLLRGDYKAMVLLGGTGALAILAEPLWWPGILVATALMALRYSTACSARRALAVALLALVVLSLPSRVSIAHQHGGDLNADVVLRATETRNIEFVGRGHGAPPDRAALAAAPAGGPKVGLGAYILGDHPLSVAAGGTLSGAYDGVAAAGARPQTKLPGLIAFLVGLIGVVFLLLLPRLRLLVLVPALVSLVPWFFVSRDHLPVFARETAFWPALLVGAACVAYALRQVTRQRIDPSALAEPVLSRRPAFLRRLTSRGQPAQR